MLLFLNLILLLFFCNLTKFVLQTPLLLKTILLFQKVVNNCYSILRIYSHYLIHFFDSNLGITIGINIKNVIIIDKIGSTLMSAHITNTILNPSQNSIINLW